MDKTPASGRHYLSSQNPSDSSDESKKYASANLVIPSGGNRDQQEGDSGRVLLVAAGDDGTSDSERTESWGIASDGHGDIMEADSGLCKARNQDSRSEDADKDEKLTGYQKTYQEGKSVEPGNRQQVIILQKNTSLLKILPEKIKVASGNGESSIQLKNTEMNGEAGEEKIPLADTMVHSLSPAYILDPHEIPCGSTSTSGPEPKGRVTCPQWIIDCKSDVADLDGWQHWQVYRYGFTSKDKFYSHRDYVYTFRSKVEVKHFLKTGEVKVKGLLQKKSSDPGQQSSGPRRSRKRGMELPASDPNRKPQGYGSSSTGEMVPNSSKLPHGFV